MSNETPKVREDTETSETEAWFAEHFPGGGVSVSVGGTGAEKRASEIAAMSDGELADLGRGVRGGPFTADAELAIAEIARRHKAKSAAGAGVSEPDERMAEPGAPHPIDKAFYDLTVNERDYERVKCDRLTGELESAEALVQSLTRERDEAVALLADLVRVKDLIDAGENERWADAVESAWINARAALPVPVEGEADR